MESCDLPLEVTLRDGTPAMIWPLLPTDADMLRAGFARLSERSRRQRFLSGLAALDDSMLRRLVTDVDQEHHVALVVVAFPGDDRPEGPIAVGRLVASPADPTTAELALTVVDEWQHDGVGHLLADALVRHRPTAVRRIVAQVAADNAASLAVLRGLGVATTRRVFPGVLEVTVADLAVALPAA